MGMRVLVGLPLAFLSSVACGSTSDQDNDGGPSASANLDGSSGSDASDTATASDTAVSDTATASGTATVSGTVGGQAFSARGALGLVESIGPGSSPAIAVVIPANFAVTCGILQSKSGAVAFANAEQLEFYFFQVGATLTPSTYRVTQPGGGGAATARYSIANGDCGVAYNETAGSGSVTITASDSAMFSGTFDLTFTNSDHLAGRFSAPICVLTSSGDTIQPPQSFCLH
jgi:hypothetical protein